MIALAAAVLWAPASGRSASPRQGIPVRVSGSDAFSSCQPSTTPSGVSFASSAVEPYLAVGSGSTPELAAVWQQDRWDNGGAQGIMAATSTDNGRSWRPAPLRFTSCSPDGLPFNRASDPWATVDPDGLVYASAIVASADSTGALSDFHVAVSTSRDGVNWSDPSVVPSGPNQIDGDEVVNDPLHPGTAYAAWEERVPDGEDTLISRTVDSGETWSPPSLIAHETLAGSGVGGTQILFYRAQNELVELVQLSSNSTDTPTLAVLTSSDGGVSWSKPHDIAQRVRWSSKGYPPIRAVDPAVEAQDPSTGDLYVAWQDARFSHGRAADIAISRSDDGGVTWTKPARAVAAGTHHLFAPAMAVTSGGVVGLSYYRVARGKHGLYPAGMWVSMSSDRGEHFGTATRAGRSFRFAMAPGTPRTSGYFLGDYEGLAASDSLYVLFSRPDGSDIAGHTEIVCGALAPGG